MRRLLWIVPLAVFILVIIGLIGLSLAVRNFLHSDEFRQQVTVRTSEAMKVDGEFAPFSWTGSSVYSESFSADGMAESLWQTFEARRLRADFDWRSIFDGAWRMEELSIGSVEAVMRPQSGPPAIPQTAPSDGDAGKSGETARRSTPSWVPQRFELGQVVIDEATLLVPSETGNVLMERVSVVVKPDGSGWQMTASGGTLDVPSFDEMQLVEATARSNGSDFFLSRAEFSLEEKGSVVASGEFSTEVGQMRVDWSEVPISVVLEEPWKSRLTGHSNGQAVWTQENQAVRGKFEVADAQLQHLPLQKQLAVFSGQPKFERLPIQIVSGDFATQGGAIAVRNFVAESRGLMRVEGAYGVASDETLTGELQLGVTPQTLQWIPGSQEKVFTESRDGYLWTTVKLSGTADRPREDLTPRLATAAGEAVIEAGSEILQSAPEETQDAVRKGLDILNSILER